METKFGVFLPSYAFQGLSRSSGLFGCLKEVVLECERLGYDSVWLDDHLMYGSMPMLECWTALSALASVSSRIRLGTMVSCGGFRNPALLAKMAATMDVISGGRLEFGIGAGVQKQEHDAYGFAFPQLPIRVTRLSESLDIIKALWTKKKTTFKGKHFQVADAVCEPKPLQKPHPPIVVGGSGEQFTLKVTAKHADRFDFGYQPSFEAYRHKLQVLESHCKTVGRKFGAIEKSCWPSGQILLGHNSKELEEKIKHYKPKNMSRVDFEKFTYIGTSEGIGSMLQPYLNLGATHFMLFFGDLPNLNSLRLFADAVIGLMRS